MTKFAIVTDTDSSLPIDLAAKYGIRQVPIGINLDGKTYETGINLDDQLIFQYLESAKQYPTTAAPSPAAFTREFETAIQAGAETIVCICVSSKVSTTYNSAVMAAETFDHDIVVIDSEYLSIGQGFMALSAAESFLSGATRDEVIQRLGGMRDRIHTYAVLPSLKFIALSGRLNKYSANIADILDIKPILTVQNGKLEVINKQRTMKKAMEKMLELLKEATGGKLIERAAVVHANCPEDGKALMEKLEFFQPELEPFILAEFTPGLSIHTGPGTVGVAILTRE